MGKVIYKMHIILVAFVFRGFTVGIYVTNNADACKYVALNSQCNVIVVENNQQLKKILQVWDDLPDLKAVVQYTGEVAEKRDNVYSVSQCLLR